MVERIGSEGCLAAAKGPNWPSVAQDRHTWGKGANAFVRQAMRKGRPARRVQRRCLGRIGVPSVFLVFSPAARCAGLSVSLSLLGLPPFLVTFCKDCVPVAGYYVGRLA